MAFDQDDRNRYTHHGSRTLRRLGVPVLDVLRHACWSIPLNRQRAGMAIPTTSSASRSRRALSSWLPACVGPHPEVVRADVPLEDAQSNRSCIDHDRCFGPLRISEMSSTYFIPSGLAKPGDILIFGRTGVVELRVEGCTGRRVRAHRPGRSSILATLLGPCLAKLLCCNFLNVMGIKTESL